MAKAQAYLRATKTRKSEVLDTTSVNRSGTAEDPQLFMENFITHRQLPCGGTDKATSPPDESCHNGETPGRGAAGVPSAPNLLYLGTRNQKTQIVEGTTFEQNAAFIRAIKLLDLDSILWAQFVAICPA